MRKRYISASLRWAALAKSQNNPKMPLVCLFK